MHTTASEQNPSDWQLVASPWIWSRAAFGVIVVLCACGSPSEPETVSEPAVSTQGCTGTVVMTVSFTPTARFEWAPACTVNALAVSLYDGTSFPRKIWVLVTWGDNRLMSGIELGDAPLGTLTTIPAPDSLEQGATYEVTLRVTEGIFGPYDTVGRLVWRDDSSVVSCRRSFPC